MEDQLGEFVKEPLKKIAAYAAGLSATTATISERCLINASGSRVNDDLLHILGCAGCSLAEFHGSWDFENYAVTDEGILEYCFSSDLGAMKDRGRTLSLQDAWCTPELPVKCIQVGISYISDHFAMVTVAAAYA